MPAGIITAMEVQKRNKQRVNVYLDDEYAFSLKLEEAARLHKGQHLTEAEVEALETQDTLARAIDTAARFLSYRPRSIQEVRENLARKDTPPPVIEAAVEKLEALGYLSDLSFAAFWVRERNTFKPLSPRALRHELRQKGVADSIIDEVLAQIDADDAAYRAAYSQTRRLRNLSRREFENKLLQFLQRRGFGYRDAKTAIRRLIETLETEENDYFRDNSDEDLSFPESDE
ncbi:MAG: RecX family transcriptional regulator [Anaerolineae bacterium]|nr:RecX family transcriptional regulator [Anaerolineae bacterium]MCA9910412.1 RecX family transcriptional regulator [Anaerolineae bacterium]